MPRATRLVRRQTEASQEPQINERERHESETTTSKKIVKGKKVSTESKIPEAEAVSDEENDGNFSDVDVKPFDPDSFEDQPLLKEDNIKLQGLAKDWSAVIDHFDKKAFQFVTTVAVAITESASEEDAKKYIDGDLEPLMREFIDMQNRTKSERDAIEAIRQKVMRDDAVLNAPEEIDLFVRNETTKWEQMTARQKYVKHNAYFTFRNAIWEGKNQDGAMPPLTNFIAREDGDEEDEDEVEVGGVTQDFKCPLTLMPLDNPYTSKGCGHSFNRDAILEYLSDGLKTCPATGCKELLSITSMEPNSGLAKRVKAHLKREARREAEDDVEDLTDSD